jgi:hypothetical protein
VAGKNTAVFGIYPSYVSVENGVDALRSAGFRNEDISALFPEGAGTKAFAYEKNTKAPEGATTGAGTGIVLGGAMGWLLGIGAIAIPGLGPFIAAGPIMAALAGAGVGGAVGRNRGSSDRNGNSGIRSQALRGPRKRWRNSAFSSFG